MRFRFFEQVATEGFFYGLFFERTFAQKNFSICSFRRVLRLLKKRYIYFRTSKTRLKLHIEKATDAVLAFFWVVSASLQHWSADCRNGR